MRNSWSRGASARRRLNEAVGALLVETMTGARRRCRARQAREERADEAVCDDPGGVGGQVLRDPGEAVADDVLPQPPRQRAHPMVSLSPSSAPRVAGIRSRSSKWLSCAQAGLRDSRRRRGRACARATWLNCSSWPAVSLRPVSSASATSGGPPPPESVKGFST